jgi:putative ABC transport system ATP-binding protein
MTGPVVDLRGVVRRFPEGTGERDVLCGVDLTATAGEVVAILGRSGSGKSTLLHVIGGIDEVDEGTVMVGGRDLATLDDAARTRYRRRHVGFVFQSFHLLPTLPVLDNVLLPLALDGRSDANATARALDLLERVGLQDRARIEPDRLSGGERQRVALARALVHRPEIVLADEPTGSLDDENAELVLGMLTELCSGEGATVVLTTHSRRTARHGTRILKLDHGRLVANDE